MQATTQFENNYSSFNEACDDAVNFLKKNQQYQLDFVANFEGRSFRVITERGSMIARISQWEFGDFERKIKIYATTDNDMKPIADKFCSAFETNLVTIVKKIN